MHFYRFALWGNKNVTPVCVFTLVVSVASFSPAAKPDNPGGGKGGGGDGVAFAIVPFAPAGAASTRTDIEDLNETGGVIGRVLPAHEGFASWHLDLDTGDYSPLPGHALALNNTGQFVGRYFDFAPDTSIGMFLADVDAEPVALPPLPDDDRSAALAINDAGIIAGTSGVSGTAVVWRAIVTEDGEVTIDGPVPLLPLDGHVTSVAVGLNNTAEGGFLVVGRSTPEAGLFSSEAVLWAIHLNPDGTLAEAGEPIALGTLEWLEQTFSFGHAVNELGVTCGESDSRPFVRPAGGPMQALPVPRNTRIGVARDINDVGDVVGDVFTEKASGARVDFDDIALLWRDGQAIDLNKTIPANSGWNKLWDALKINNAGEIAGWGNFEGASRGFILLPEN